MTTQSFYYFATSMLDDFLPALNIYLSSSLGSERVGVEWTLCIRFQSSILFAVVNPLHPTTNTPFLSRLGTETGTPPQEPFSGYCGGVFGKCTKQKSRFKFLPWLGFEPQTVAV